MLWLGVGFVIIGGVVHVIICCCCCWSRNDVLWGDWGVLDNVVIRIGLPMVMGMVDM